VWTWMMTYPMQNNVWANYFEDVPIQTDLGNINQLNPMMLARYLMEHPENDANWETHVRSLIAWVEENFAVPQYGANAIKEQNAFMHVMGSHTSRYASINAMLYARTGDVVAKEKAYRAFNWATYMARSNGIVIDGPTVNNQWFTDGYGDYIRHFMTGLHAIPEWAPTGETHITGSSSIVKSVSYSPAGVDYVTADAASTEVLRVAFVPSSVLVGAQLLSQRSDLAQPGWTFDPATGVMLVRHDNGTSVKIGANALFGTLWSTYSKAKMTVRRLGSRSGANDSTMIFNDDGTFTLTEVESPQTYVYTGHWKLIKGKKLFLDLDAGGQSEFMRMWTNRLEEIATEKGISIDGVNFSEIRFILSQPKIPKNKLVPRNATIKAKGWISASANGQDIMRRFTYINRVTFLNQLLGGTTPH